MCAAVPLISRALMEMVIKETVSKLCFAIAWYREVDFI
jgi:hypothetical protein